MQPTRNDGAGRRSRWTVAAGLMAVGLLAGCRQDMHNQPKFYPQRGSSFYADGRSVRPQVTETVGRSQLHQDAYFYTGFVNGKEGDGMPFPVSLQVLERGQERYNIYCTPCHSRVGNGGGMIVQRGYAKAGNFHTDRLRAAPLGHFFNVISNGYGAMPDYSAQLTESERWSVIAYVRALQLSQKATQQDVKDGAHAEPLDQIAEREGLPPGFAGDWVLPPTAVQGTTTGKDYAIPLATDVNPARMGSNGTGNTGEQSGTLSGASQGTAGPGTGQPASAGHAMTSPAGSTGATPGRP